MNSIPGIAPRGIRAFLALAAFALTTSIGSSTARAQQSSAVAPPRPAAAAPAAAGASPVYTIELVIFRNAGGPGASEDWTAPAPRPPRAAEAGGSEAGGGGAVVVGRFSAALAPAQLQLGDLRGRLAAGGAYQPLAHFGWSQTASSWGSRAGFTLQRLGISVPGLSGMVYLERGSFLHLGVALKYTPAAGGPTYEINELRRVRFYDKNYYDHPGFGVIAVVTPVQGPRAAGR